METEKISFFDTEVIAINIGVQQFAESLIEQETEVIHIDWSPPAGGDQEMIDILEDLL